jgi:IS4 transposase
VTSLLDPVEYLAADLAALYAKRWEVETNLRHLKQILGMDVLRTKSLDGIHEELAMFAIVYNLVRLSTGEAPAAWIAALRGACWRGAASRK